MRNPFQFIFRSVPKEQSPISPTEVSNGAKVGLTEEQAVSQLLILLTKFPDLDEVLKQAGIRRDKLKVLLYDDEIAQAVETRMDALISTPVRLEPSDTPQSLFVQDQLKNNLDAVIAGAFQARLFGYSVMEVVYKDLSAEKGVGSIGIEFVGEKPLEWFEPKSDGRLMYYPDNGAGGVYGIEIDQVNKFLLTRCKPTYLQPYGEALLSRLYWPWFFRYNGWKFWAKFLERFGAPLLVGKSTDTKAMVSALLLAHSQAVIGIDRADSVEAVGASGGNNGAAFESFETALIRRVQKLVLGQTLTSGTDGGSGNRALGQVHNSVRNDKRDSDIRLVRPTVQHLVDSLCQLNGFQPLEVVFADETGLEADRATRDKDLYAVGVRFTPEYFKDAYALTDDDFTVTSATPVDATPTPVDPNATPQDPTQPTDEPAPLPNPKAQAARLYLSKDGTFTPNQQVLENLADDALANAGNPIDPEKLRTAILAAHNPEDLAHRLFALLGDSLTETQFTKILERSLYAADVLGYINAAGK